MIVEVFCDGAARRNQGTGEGAIGVVIYRNKKLIGQFARGLGKVNNNVAELEAIIHGIMLCWAADLKDPVIYSDSLVSVNQINEIWRARSAAIKTLLLSIKELKEVFRFRIQHVDRSYVQEADSLAHAFLDKLDEHLKPVVE